MTARDAMTSLERVLTTLGHSEPDRVPFFLLNNLHGAKEMGLEPREYFRDPDLVARGQLGLREKYRDDCLYSFFYAAIEMYPWGGEVNYSPDGPPTAAEPVIHRRNIPSLEVPDVESNPDLRRVLDATESMKKGIGDEAPIIGVVMSPFSLPVMQMGFAEYLSLIYEYPEEFWSLMRVNREFCVRWANAQLKAGATAICYFDPVSSPTIIPEELYGKTGLAIGKSTLGRIEGPTATHLASGIALPIMPRLPETGTAAVGVGDSEDLRSLKASSLGRISLLGNLNGIKMVNWDHRQAEEAVVEAIDAAAAGGGFILSDNHGELPLQVPEDAMMAISEAVHEHGRYGIAPGEGKDG